MIAAPLIATVMGATSAISPEFDLLLATNVVRTEHQLRPLSVSPELSTAAQWMAEDLSRSGSLDHKDSNGRMPWDRASAFGYQGYRVVRENLATNFATGRDVVQAWLNSKSHRVNQLADDCTEVGIGFARVPGTRTRNYWVLLLGKR